MGWTWMAVSGALAVATATSPTAVGVVAAQRPAAAAPGATIQGVVATQVKASRALRVTFDQKVCGAELPDQSVVVDGGGRLANAVVTLMGVKARAPAREIRVLNDKCAFVPRVQVVASKGMVKTSSQDPVLHTTTVQLPDGRQLFNVALPVPGMEIAKPLAGAGALRVSCSTHQWMRGWIVVTDDVAAVTGPDGRFTLSDVPPGTYQLRVWHEALKAADQTITVVAGKSNAANFELR
jgi:Carboxypeptidase regulatory-like domain